MTDGREAWVAAELLVPAPQAIRWSRIPQKQVASKRLVRWRERWDQAHAGEVVHRKVALSRFRCRQGNNQLELVVRGTDWREVRIAHLALAESKDLAEELIAEVRSRQVFSEPNIFGVHAIMVLPGGEVIATRRSRSVHFHPGKWSLSFEEGLEPSDLDTPDPLESAAVRGISEEFGLDASTVAAVEPLGLVFEPALGNPGLLARIRLKLSGSEFGQEVWSGMCDEWDDVRVVAACDDRWCASRELHATSRMRLKAHRGTPAN